MLRAAQRSGSTENVSRRAGPGRQDRTARTISSAVTLPLRRWPGAAARRGSGATREGGAIDRGRESLEPLAAADRPGAGRARRRLDLKGELLLALLPTPTVLGVLGLLEVFSRQRLLFASLASSAFLSYLDSHHGGNAVRTLVPSHLLAATAGLVAYLAIGHGYAAAGTAMVATFFPMVVLDLVHPPAVSTSLTFALRTGAESEAHLFALAPGMTAALVVMQRVAVWLLGHVGAHPG